MTAITPALEKRGLVVGTRRAKPKVTKGRIGARGQRFMALRSLPATGVGEHDAGDPRIRRRGDG